MPAEYEHDYIIIGAGIIGLTIARELKKRFPEADIAILEKEADVAYHASGRNSGVLHAGFYYTADSLKARFTKQGNALMKEYCHNRGIPVNPVGKVVVARDKTELAGLKELKRRADVNGVELHWVNEDELKGIDPNVKTYGQALHSPTTASVDPLVVCQTLKNELLHEGLRFYFNTRFIGRTGHGIKTTAGKMAAGYLINAAGLYADKIAHSFSFGLKYTIIPFKGVYLKYGKDKNALRTNIYPVPNLGSPFLGVHFTKTVNDDLKIGPTAIPAFWRENYIGLSRFRFTEFLQIGYHEAVLFLRNSFQFRSLALEEMKKYAKSKLISLALYMVKEIDPSGFEEYGKPGIRAQLLNKQTRELVQDFILEGDAASFHVLNAVSPAFTCSMPFAEYIVDQIVQKRTAALIGS